MIIEKSIRGTTEVIQLQGRFDHASSQKFHNAIRGIGDEKSTSQINVDLGAVDYIDSSACGMLLFLRNKASESGKTVVLENAKGVVKNVLDVMQFAKLFTIM